MFFVGLKPWMAPGGNRKKENKQITLTGGERKKVYQWSVIPHDNCISGQLIDKSVKCSTSQLWYLKSKREIGSSWFEWTFVPQLLQLQEYPTIGTKHFSSGCLYLKLKRLPCKQELHVQHQRSGRRRMFRHSCTCQRIDHELWMLRTVVIGRSS